MKWHYYNNDCIYSMCKICITPAMLSICKRPPLLLFVITVILSSPLLSSSSPLLCSPLLSSASPSMRGSTPLDVAAASVMDNNELALALREPDLEKVRWQTLHKHSDQRYHRLVVRTLSTSEVSSWERDPSHVALFEVSMFFPLLIGYFW